MDSLRRLEEIFAHFPGIGPRQARRFVYYLLNKSGTSVTEFIDLIKEVRRSSAECAQCHRFFIQSGTSQPSADSLCPICSDPSRDQATLMVVGRDSDFETVEKSGIYKGLYFILGGTVPVLDKDPEKRIRLRDLLERVSNSSDAAGHNSLTEIILSLNTTPDGEHTTTILKDALANVLKNKPTRISILGRGLSTGAELEYADSETIRNALENRG